eukprot:TRINITY_DN2021_c0_g3_i10.p2 TRINITY_DN2021_c0_g3~~TRINITY_DN2021_c0_g3_i10.p2  ORF type:complete len:135 (-),score=14.87 TRINITY_DN2021_c0_g3_i10:273-677(-)
MVNLFVILLRNIVGYLKQKLENKWLICINGNVSKKPKQFLETPGYGPDFGGSSGSAEKYGAFLGAYKANAQVKIIDLYYVNLILILVCYLLIYSNIIFLSMQNDFLFDCHFNFIIFQTVKFLLFAYLLKIIQLF